MVTRINEWGNDHPEAFQLTWSYCSCLRLQWSKRNKFSFAHRWSLFLWMKHVLRADLGIREKDFFFPTWSTYSKQTVRTLLIPWEGSGGLTWGPRHPLESSAPDLSVRMYVRHMPYLCIYMLVSGRRESNWLLPGSRRPKSIQSKKDHAVYSDLFSSRPKCKPEGYHAASVQYVALSLDFTEVT
jgi:hypothetical protein